MSRILDWWPALLVFLVLLALFGKRDSDMEASLRLAVVRTMAAEAALRECPACRADLRPGRVVGEVERDRVVRWRCPDCGAVWERK